MILPDLARRDLRATERMDDPECDTRTLERTYAQFRVVNAVVAGWRATYRRHLRPVLRRDRPTTALDIGCGGGDVSRSLLRWARRDGFDLRITGIDPDPRAHAWARRQPPTPGLTFRRALSSDLVEQGERFDVVFSNHLLHHLGDRQFEDLLRDCEQLATARAIHSDIARSPVAYALFSVATWPLFPGSFIREDGLVSIRRSYTPSELRAQLPPAWQVTAQPPWRTLTIHSPGPR